MDFAHRKQFSNRFELAQSPVQQQALQQALQRELQQQPQLKLIQMIIIIIISKIHLLNKIYYLNCFIVFTGLAFQIVFCRQVSLLVHLN